MVRTTDIGMVDIAIIGGGLAAMYAALEASNHNESVAIISKKPVGKSGASVISKSIHRFPPNNIKEKLSYKDAIIEAGRYINNLDLVDTFVESAPQKMNNIRKLKIGLNFKEKLIEGENYAYFAACKPKIGKYLTIPLSKIIKTKDNINIMEGYMAIQLVTDKNTICGIILENNNRLYFLNAKAVVIATGGGGYSYFQTSNTNDLTGDGYAMALRAGLSLIDMEFIQFYPYRIVYPFRHDIFPEIFSHGAKYLNKKGERFMEKYPKKELENRDILAREMFFQDEVYLNIENCNKDFIIEECDDLYDNYLKYKGEKIKVSPVAHFMMGGIKINPDTSTDIKGLFCCGEVSGGLHGANRLAGHALTETVVFGHIAGVEAARYARNNETRLSVDPIKKEKIVNWLPEIGNESMAGIKNISRRNMWKSAGIIRNEKDLQLAKDKLEELEQQMEYLRPLKLRDWAECRNMIQTSKVIIDACILRKESRGAHYRSDFPEEDINWQRNIIIN